MVISDGKNIQNIGSKCRPDNYSYTFWNQLEVLKLLKTFKTFIFLSDASSSNQKEAANSALFNIWTFIAFVKRLKIEVLIDFNEWANYRYKLMNKSWQVFRHKIGISGKNIWLKYIERNFW